MQLIILKENLKRALNIVDKAIKQNIALPVLKNVLIKTFNNRIKFSSNNLEIGINASSLGKIIEEGSITVPYVIISQIVQNIESEKIILETEKDVLVIKTDNYHAKIQGINEKEFPIIPKIENTNDYIQIKGDVLKRYFNHIATAIQISDLKPEISGLLFNYQMSQIICVGTDTFRLIEKVIHKNEFTSTFSNSFQVIIPLKTIQDLVRMILDTEDVKLYIDQNQIVFQTEQWELVSRLIDGIYPDYDFIIPKETETEINLDTKSFFQSLKLVSNFSSKINDVKLQCTDKKILKVYSSNPYIGESEFLLPVKIKGKELPEVIFNWSYLHDVNKIIEEEELTLGFNHPDKPVVFRNKNNKSIFYILMPIKLT